tara:strand:+ start:41 stop:190 length:150 start_codon:yes stop_codon:yes gene_type:complete
MTIRKYLMQKMRDYTPEESKRIYRVLRDEWEQYKKHQKLIDQRDLGGYQ